MRPYAWMLVTLLCLTALWARAVQRGPFMLTPSNETADALDVPHERERARAPRSSGAPALAPERAAQISIAQEDAEPAPTPPVAPANPPAPAPQKVDRSPALLTVDGVLAGARRAIGKQSASVPGGNVLVQGVAHLGKTSARFSLMFNPKGCYLQEVEGPITVASGFDGSATWALVSTAEKGYADADLTLPEGLVAVFTGRWAAVNGPCAVRGESPEPGDAAYTACLIPNGGGRQFYVEVDQSTWLPQAAYWVQAGGRETWKLTDYRRELGIMLPHRLVRVRGAGTDTFQINHVGAAPVFSENPYKPAGLRLARLRDQQQEMGGSSDESGGPSAMRG